MNDVLWDMTPCDSNKERRFGGKYYLHFQSYKTMKKEAICASETQSLLQPHGVISRKKLVASLSRCCLYLSILP
jgi:hypothetical protein